ncbi:MAG TPA: T9SS type A sorting domain-containing protein [Mariniphaga anaerophila]|uniref:T9SS type A sorting domain-containing protein n=1 Tax=Mariniphaga anaerophila TaxID=1484053 RepID=A0A831PMV5_9BACT|nr:T9SS type A sorting domain-containing protein [Mariniphaga anaerophila]
MKSIFAFAILMLIYTAGNAQVTLEKKYDYSTSVVEFETLGFKYYLMDVPNGQCRVYNLDHSLFKTINCNVPAGFYLYDIKFLSEKLFDNDAGIELLCTFYKYNASPEYYEYDSKIINEDGSQVVFIDGALYNYINKTGENTYKLFSYCYDFSVWPEKVWTNIYNLPGTPVVSAFLENENPEFNLKAFPNPATSQLKVAYNLPTEVREGTLFLFDNSGRLVQQFIIDNHTDHLLLNVLDYKSGVYHYFVEYGNRRSPSQKLVVR